MEDYALDTEAVISHLGLTATILVGHSMGARIAAKVAERGHVEVAATILLEPPMSGPGRSPYPTAIADLLKQWQDAVQGVTPAELRRRFPQWDDRALEIRAAWLPTCDPTAIEASHHGFETEDFVASFRSLTTPTALVRGEDSPVVTAAYAEEARLANPAALMESVPGAGHMLLWEQPQASLEVIQRLIEHLSPEGPVSDTQPLDGE